MRGSAAISTEACIETNVKTACCATVPTREHSIRSYRASRKPTVTETTNMDESNGTNLNPISSILFFNKVMKIEEY
jgi:hypothetical protein